MSLPIVFAVAITAAVIGDNLGYLVGRRVGHRVLTAPGRWEEQRRQFLDEGEHFFARHGGKTVFFGRWLPVLRFTAALLAGVNEMPWRRFFVFNALGAIGWVCTVGSAAYILGSSASSLFEAIGLRRSARGRPLHRRPHRLAPLAARARAARAAGRAGQRLGRLDPDLDEVAGHERRHPAVCGAAVHPRGDPVHVRVWARSGRERGRRSPPPPRSPPLRRRRRARPARAGRACAGTRSGVFTLRSGVGIGQARRAGGRRGRRRGAPRSRALPGGEQVPRPQERARVVGRRERLVVAGGDRNGSVVSGQRGDDLRRRPADAGAAGRSPPGTPRRARPPTACIPAATPSSGPRPATASSATSTPAGSGSACPGAATTTTGSHTRARIAATRWTSGAPCQSSRAFGVPMRLDGLRRGRLPPRPPPSVCRDVLDDHAVGHPLDRRLVVGERVARRGRSGAACVPAPRPARAGTAHRRQPIARASPG